MWKDNETEFDLLDFDYLTKIVINIIYDKKLSPSSIGIYGNWGSGKSSLMKLCIKELSKNKAILCIEFNGWLFESYEDAKTALIGTILDEIDKHKKFTSKVTDIITRLYTNTDKLKLLSKGIKSGFDFVLTGGIGTLADLTINTIASKLGDKSKDISKDDIENILKNGFQSKEIRQNIKNIRKDFKDLLESTNIEKLVVFIDELDRCNPDTIMETFEAIRLFLFIENTSFIIGADERHVTYSVKKKYSEIVGNQIDIGKEYLEKIIQYPIRIPQLSNREVEFYILYLFFQNELSTEEFDKVYKYIIESKQNNFFEFEFPSTEFYQKLPEIANKTKETVSLAKQLSSVLSIGLNGNPRHCKRFLNSLMMRIKMAELRNIKIERKVLAKLMLLEYFKSDFFKKLSEVSLSEKGKSTAIKNIENNNWNENVFELWKDDIWVQNWLITEPPLSDIDLRPYFYFSRESLSTQLNIGPNNLSPLAEKILKNLISGSESFRLLALKETDKINDSELNIILDNMFNKIEIAEEITPQIFQSFLSLGAKSQTLSISTINYLKRISGKKLSFTHIPAVKLFMETTKRTEIQQIVSQWGIDNESLKKAITINFKENK